MTRRCTQRQFLLLPTRETTQTFGYCLGIALQRSGVQLHAGSAQSNHHHQDVTDSEAALAEFKHLFHSLLARAMNAHWGRFENFFAAEGPSDVELVTPEEILDRMVYTLTNPVKHGLVRSGRDWEGFTTWGKRFGSKMVFKRPEHFFDPDGALPDEVTIEVERPDIYPELSDDDLFALLMKKVRQRERELRAEAKKQGKRFLGMKRVLRQKHTDTPWTREPRFTLNPRVASRSMWHRIAALQRNKKWLETYREAYEKFCRGVRDVVFPQGTYLMRVRYGVACQSP